MTFLMCVIDTILIIMQLCVGDLHNACNLRIMHNRQNQHNVIICKIYTTYTTHVICITCVINLITSCWCCTQLVAASVRIPGWPLEDQTRHWQRRGA